MTDDNNQEKTEIAALEKSVQEKMQKLESGKLDSVRAASVPAKPEMIATTRSKADWWSVTDAMTISSSVLIFGCVIILLATYLLHKGKNADDVLKLFGTLVTIISAVFLVVAGYTDTQIAPVIGLLGTIAGYLLGRRSSETQTPEHKPIENTISKS
jgi:hypothetical protein